MSKKYIPSEEQLKEILAYYSMSGSYQEVSRRTGLSAAIVKRIIEENLEEKKEFNVKNYVYNGFPPEEPSNKQIVNFNTELEQFFLEAISKNGVL